MRNSAVLVCALVACFAGCSGNDLRSNPDAPSRADDAGRYVSKPLASSDGGFGLRGTEGPDGGTGVLAAAANRFDGTSTHGSDWSARPSRRLSSLQYVNLAEDVLGVRGRDRAALLPRAETALGARFDEPGQPSALRAAAIERLAEQLAFGAPTRTLLSFAPCRDLESPCIDGFVANLGLFLYRAPVTPQQLATLGRVFSVSAAAISESSSPSRLFEEAARYVLWTMLQAPQFIYRLEASTALSTQLGGHELASRLSFLIWNSGPDLELFQQAEAGDLSTPKQVQQQASRMLSHPRARRAAADYVETWLGLHQLESANENAALVLRVSPGLRQQMLEETRQFASRVWVDEGAELLSLLIDRETALTPELAQHYAYRGPQASLNQELVEAFLPISPGVFAPYSYAQTPERLGILTQAAVIGAHSSPDGTSTVQRGAFALASLLCGAVPERPQDVEPSVEFAEVPFDAPARERFAAHSANPQCRSCHELLDPLGYAFEPYDSAGRYRTRDDAGNPTRSDGEILLDGQLQSFQNTAEFAQLLSESATVRRCVVNKYLQYASGRLVPDETVLSDALEQTMARGATYEALVFSMVQAAWFYQVSASERADDTEALDKETD
jgi:hypothetical protein